MSLYKIRPIKDELEKEISTDHNLLFSKEPHYTIELEHTTLKYNLEGGHNYSGPRKSKYDNLVYSNFNKAFEDARKLFNEYKDEKEITDNSYSYYSVNITHWEEGAGYNVDINDNDIGIMSTFTAYNEDELFKVKNKIKDESKKIFVIKNRRNQYFVGMKNGLPMLTEANDKTNAKHMSENEANKIIDILGSSYEVKEINNPLHDATSSREELVKEIAKLLNMQETECMGVFEKADVEDIENFLQNLKLFVKEPLKEKWEKWSPKN